MYIAIYVSVIVFLCICAIVFFVVRDKKIKKKQQILLEKELKNQQDEGKQTEQTEVQEIKPQKIDDANFEDYTLQIEEPAAVKPPSSIDLNPFQTYADEEESDEQDDDDVDNKFKEYEDFLRNKLNIDDDFDEDESDMRDFLDQVKKDTDSEESQDDLEALKNFDYNSLKGKNEEEIVEIIKSLPPKAQQILMTDILARKNFDDED